MATRTHPIRRFRQAKKLSQQQLADMLGVSGMTVYRWEIGQRFPRRDQWPAITQTTGVRPDQFLKFIESGDASA